MNACPRLRVPAAEGSSRRGGGSGTVRGSAPARPRSPAAAQLGSPGAYRDSPAERHNKPSEAQLISAELIPWGCPGVPFRSYLRPRYIENRSSRWEPWQESPGVPVLRFKGETSFFSLSFLNIAQLMNALVWTGRASRGTASSPRSLAQLPTSSEPCGGDGEPGDSWGWTPLPAGVGPRSSRGRRMRRAGAGFIPAPLPGEIPRVGKRSSGLSAILFPSLIFLNF